MHKSNNVPINLINTPHAQQLNAQPVPIIGGATSSALGSKVSMSDKDSVVHLRVQKRTGRKCLTFVQGLPKSVDIKTFTQKLRKAFNCNCTEIDHPKLGECIQLSGDRRDDLKRLLIKNKIVRDKKQIKVHGY